MLPLPPCLLSGILQLFWLEPEPETYAVFLKAMLSNASTSKSRFALPPTDLWESVNKPWRRRNVIDILCTMVVIMYILHSTTHSQLHGKIDQVTLCSQFHFPSTLGNVCRDRGGSSWWRQAAFALLSHGMVWVAMRATHSDVLLLFHVRALVGVGAMAGSPTPRGHTSQLAPPP